MKLTNRVALVTGSSRGIGRSIVDLFAENGATVIVNATKQEEVEKAVLELRTKGFSAYACVCDVTDRNALELSLKEVQQQSGKVSILVNNVGISPKKNGKRVPVHEMDPHEWDRVVDVNFTSMFNCCHLLIPNMLELGYGKIINISSLSARQYTWFTSSHYIATKAAVIGFTHALSGELCSYGINCNCIAPGRAWTDLTRTLPEEVNLAIAETIPVKRLAECEEIANVALFLASEESSYIHGATIDVNGGCFMN